MAVCLHETHCVDGMGDSALKYQHTLSGECQQYMHISDEDQANLFTQGGSSLEFWDNPSFLFVQIIHVLLYCNHIVIVMLL